MLSLLVAMVKIFNLINISINPNTYLYLTALLKKADYKYSSKTVSIILTKNHILPNSSLGHNFPLTFKITATLPARNKIFVEFFCLIRSNDNLRLKIQF